MLVELAHFNNARRYVASLLVTGGIFAAIGLGLIGAIAARLIFHWIPPLSVYQRSPLQGPPFWCRLRAFSPAAS